METHPLTPGLPTCPALSTANHIYTNSPSLSHTYPNAHDWFISNQMVATAAGYPMMAWTAFIEALSKRFNPLKKPNWLETNSVDGDKSKMSKLTIQIFSKSLSTFQALVWTSNWIAIPEA